MAKLILFTGKGGVGKSTTSAATAFHYASMGFKTLLVSSDPAHSTEDVVAVPVGATPTPIRENLWAMNIHADVKAKDFQKTLMEQMDSTVAKWFPGFDAEILTDWTSFPGIDEVFALEEIMNLVQSVEYDLVVFDTAPTGHTLKALTAPDSFNKFLLRILRMKSRVEGIKSIFIRKTDTDALVKILEDATKKIENFKKLLRNAEFVNVNLVSIPTEAGYQECVKTCNFLANQGFKVNNIVVNNMIPSFDDSTWEIATQNKAVALLKSERSNQQPYIKLYHQLTKESNINLIGVSKLPFEPRGERLLEFGRFLKNLNFDPEYSQTWEVNDDKATLRLRFPHSGKVTLYDDHYKIDMLSYDIHIPEDYKDMKVRKQKTESGATYTFK
jgi:arsenite/tail-anchored protein-transporting ATPase